MQIHIYIAPEVNHIYICHKVCKYIERHQYKRGKTFFVIYILLQTRDVKTGNAYPLRIYNLKQYKCRHLQSIQYSLLKCLWHWGSFSFIKNDNGERGEIKSWVLIILLQSNSSQSFTTYLNHDGFKTVLRDFILDLPYKWKVAAFSQSLPFTPPPLSRLICRKKSESSKKENQRQWPSTGS